MIAQTISHYKILEKLGEGGMGVVYKAEDVKLRRTVALKFLPHHLTSTKEEEARFLQEAQAAATLNHTNVCTIFAVEEHEGQQFIAMEYVDGVTLRQKMETGPLKLNQAISYAVQVGEALQEAHSKGIVHRDIKADNIMVNSKNQVKVMDFGLAKLKGSLKLTRSSSTVGTLAYMAPEQVQGGEVDARSDNFSFGVVLYEMLAGRTPFRGEHDAAMMYSILNEEPEPLERYLSETSPELQRIVSRALEKDPDDRYQSAADMVSELRRLQKQTSRVSRKPLEEMKPEQTPASVEREPEAAKAEMRPEGPKKTPGGPTTRVGKARIVAYSGIALAILALGALAVNLLFFGTERASADKKSIAVLPFKSLSEEKESEFFSDGITEDIIAQLSKIGDLRVISRTSVMRYKKSDKTIRDIGKELGVATILEGSVRRAGNEIRIVAQLIDASNDEHLWADTYDRELTQIFTIQSDIAQKIASSLKAKLTSSEKRRIEKKPTENLDAYTFYLKGREYYYRYHKQENENAIQLFKNALELDPNYALAYAGLGDAYGQRVGFGFAEAWLDSAIAVSNEALSIDPNLSEAYKALGLAYQMKGWTQKGIDAYAKSVELNPNYYPAVANTGFSYWFLGRLDEALFWMKKALALNPSFPYIYLGVGGIYASLGMDDRAEEQMARSLELQPDFVSARFNLALLYLRQGRDQEAEDAIRKVSTAGSDDIESLVSVAGVLLYLGDYSEARPLFEKAASLSSGNRRPSAQLGFIYWKANQKEKAREKFRESLKTQMESLERGNEFFFAPYAIAQVNAIQGNRQEAYKWLKKAVDAGWRDYRLCQRDPLLENLRNDDEFKQIMAEVKTKLDEMRNRVEKQESND